MITITSTILHDLLNSELFTLIYVLFVRLHLFWVPIKLALSFRSPAVPPTHLFDCLFVCLSVCLHVTTRERLKAFKLNLLLKCFAINCPRICHYDRTALSAPCVQNYTYFLLAWQSAFIFYTNWFLYIRWFSARIHRKHKISELWCF